MTVYCKNPRTYSKDNFVTTSTFNKDSLRDPMNEPRVTQTPVPSPRPEPGHLVLLLHLKQNFGNVVERKYRDQVQTLPLLGLYT